jgi:hypothetical protein
VFTKIRFVIASITLAVVGVSVSVSASEDAPFRAKAASEYANQASEKVTVGAKEFDTEELTAEAFGKKADLLKYGLLPVLVVIENKRDRAIDIQNIQVELVATDGRHGQAISPEDVMHMGETGKKPPKLGGGPLPFPLPKKKNPLNTPEIVERSFSAKVVPANDSVSGFFYFEARPEAGDSLYLSGVRDVRTSKELLYYEFPLAAK